MVLDGRDCFADPPRSAALRRNDGRPTLREVVRASRRRSSTDQLDELDNPLVASASHDVQAQIAKPSEARGDDPPLGLG